MIRTDEEILQTKFFFFTDSYAYKLLFNKYSVQLLYTNTLFCILDLIFFLYSYVKMTMTVYDIVQTSKHNITAAFLCVGLS